MFWRQLVWFLARAAVNGLMIALAVALFGQVDEEVAQDNMVWMFLLAGLVFAVLNAVVKPFLVIAALPLILLSMGLMMVLINVLLVFLALRFLPGIEMGFWGAVGTSLMLAIGNYFVSVVGARRQDGRND